jgi:spermidine synthase
LETYRKPFISAYVFGVFFFSGFTALTYQVCWSKVLSQTIGTDTLSWVLTISVFLVGLASGSALCEAAAKHSRHPLGLFFLLELGLSFFGAASGPLLRWVAQWSAHLVSDPLSIQAYTLDFVLNGVVLFPATLAMGAALPLLLMSTSSSEAPLKSVASLYTLNTLGAACGALWAGVVSIGAFGIQNSLLLAAGAQALIAILSLFLWRKGAFYEAKIAERPAAPGAWGGFYIAAFCLGFIALSYELVYFRVLTYFFAGSAYVTPVALASYLFLLALGYGSVRVSKKNNAVRLFRTCALAAIVSTALVFLAPYANYFLAVPFYKLKLSPGSGLGGISRSFLLACTFMAPVAFLAVLFPSLFAKATENHPLAKAYFGRFLCAQALGNLVGALLTALVLLPWLGTVGVFQLNLVLLSVLAIVWGTAAGASRWKNGLQVLLVLSATLVVTFSGFLKLFADGVWKLPLTVWEDRQGTIFVYESGCQKKSRIARLGSEDIADLPTTDQNRQVFPLDLAQAIRGNVPPKRILIIGLGRGDQAVLLKKAYPDAEVDVVELLPSIVEEMRVRGSPLAKEILPSLNLFFADGRRFLNRVSLRNPGAYDLIQIGVLNVSAAGAGNLFTREALKEAKVLLSPSGALFFTAYPPVLKAADGLFPAIAVGGRDSQAELVHAVYSNQPLPDEISMRKDFLAARAQFQGLLGSSSFTPGRYFSTRLVLNPPQLTERFKSVGLQRDDLPVTEYFMSQRTTVDGPLPDTVISAYRWLNEGTQMKESQIKW